MIGARRIARAGAALATALVAIACGVTDPPIPPAPDLALGTFEAEIRGAVSRDITGVAVLDSIEGYVWVSLDSDDSDDEIRLVTGILASGPFLFPAGTHDVSALGQVNATFQESSSDPDVFVATRGEMRVYERTATGAIARFDFVAITSSDPPRQVRVIGSFHAARAQ